MSPSSSLFGPVAVIPTIEQSPGCAATKVPHLCRWYWMISEVRWRHASRVITLKSWPDFLIFEFIYIYMYNYIYVYISLSLPLSPRYASWQPGTNNVRTGFSHLSLGFDMVLSKFRWVARASKRQTALRHLNRTAEGWAAHPGNYRSESWRMNLEMF